MIAQLPDLRAEIATLLREQNEKRHAEHVPSGMTWVARSLGGCLRSQYLSRHVKKSPTWTRTLEEKDKLNFKYRVGDFWEEIFSILFTELGYKFRRQVEVHDSDLDVAGQIDFMIDSPFQLGVEVKSVHSTYFWYRARYQDNISTPENFMQAATYEICKSREGDDRPWAVLPISKDDFWFELEPVTEAHVAAAHARLNALNRAKRLSEPPPCTCSDPNGSFGGTGWRFCDYFEGKPDRDFALLAYDEWKKNRKKDKPPFVLPGRCCVID